ncbi:Uncharacterised protein [Photobacterium damselae]|uniref:Uncharacterized protein n=1 Tax=Photobacterium damselae TaxID=38293 RepID=A0A2X1XNM5_PHODM|nr:Uncharacterised protein [Photobacterium damselae]
MLDSNNVSPEVELDDIQSRYPTQKYNKADYPRLVQNRRHLEFLQELRALGLTYEEYIEYEARKISPNPAV